MKVNYYKDHHRFYLAVDCIIFGFDGEDLNLLLIKRDFEPMKGQWSLMGGFLREDETPDQAAERVLFDLTGIKDIYLEHLQAYGDINRDPGERVVSLAYYALIKTDYYDLSQSRNKSVRWFRLDDIPDLVFDHNDMVDKALRRLRRRSRTQPIGFNLLPEKFTLPMLQRLYEAIFQLQFDKRNFRKKILVFDVLVKLEEKEKSHSRKGAWLYKFDRTKYAKLLDAGGNFEI